MPSFETQADIFTSLSVFDSPKGSSNIFKTHKNISLYFKRRYLIIYKYCSKNFATGPYKFGNMVCQMENRIESRKNQGYHILQVRSRQKNRAQPKTVWRDT